MVDRDAFDASNRANEAGLRDYADTLWRRRGIVALTVMCAVGAALLLSLLAPKVYQSQAKISISDQGQGMAVFEELVPQGLGQPERAVQTQAQLLLTEPIADKVIRSLNLQITPAELLEHVEVQPIGQTNVLLVSAQNEDPEKAAAIANAFASQFVAWSRDSRRRRIDDAITEVEGRLSTLEADLMDLGARATAPNGQTPQLEAAIRIASQNYATLSEKLESLRVSEQLEVGVAEVVSPGTVSDVPISPKPLQNSLLALAAGLALGLGLAFVVDQLDDGMKSASESEALAGAPSLATVSVSTDTGKAERRLAAVSAGSPASAEGYREMRNALDFVNFNHQVKVLMVTSSMPGEGKSSTVANLGVALAQVGYRVVVIDCDLHRPTLQDFFQLSNTTGLSDVLRGSVEPGDALARPLSEPLRVLTAGQLPPNSSELLSSEQMGRFIKAVASDADWVLLDTPPVLPLSDAASLVRWTDGVIIATRIGVSKRSNVAEAVTILRNAGAKIVGTVTLTSQRSGAATAGYGYYANQNAAGARKGGGASKKRRTER